MVLEILVTLAVLAALVLLIKRRLSHEHHNRLPRGFSRRKFVGTPLGDGLSGLCGASVAMSDRSKSRRPRAKAGLGMNPVFKCGAIGVCATVVLVACEYTVAVHLLYPLLCIPSKCARG